MSKKIKKKTANVFQNYLNIQNSYRYIVHLKNELTRKKSISLRKNRDYPANAEILADFFDELISFVDAELEYLQVCLKYPLSDGIKEKKDSKQRVNQIISKIRWTANKIDLVELIYALYHSRCLNRGEIEIKAIIEAFEQLFNVKLGNYYRTYVDIPRRAKRTKFLCELINVAESKFIEMDGK